MEICDSKILLIDDERELLQIVSRILTDAGFSNVDTAINAADADVKINKSTYHLVVLDVMMPDMNGFSLFEKWQRDGINIPVIFLSARDEDMDRLKGLGLGADDYVTKPFLPQELLLRIKAVLRRTYKISDNPSQIIIGNCRISFDEALAYRDGMEIPLTVKELDLLKKLCENRGRIVQTESLLNALWHDESYGYENALMVHIRKLREKIEENPSEPEHILTVRGLGYKLKK